MEGLEEAVSVERKRSDEPGLDLACRSGGQEGLHTPFQGLLLEQFSPRTIHLRGWMKPLSRYLGTR